MGLLKAKKCFFPNYTGLKHPEAQNIGIDSVMVLINHKGKVLKVGNVTDKEIKAAIKDATESSPMWDSIDVTHNRNEAIKLQIGKPVLYGLKKLSSIAKKLNEQGKEAKDIINAVNKWGENEKAEIEKLKQSSPSQAFKRMMILNETFKGLPLVKDYQLQLAKLKQDRYLNTLLNLRVKIEKLEASKKPSSVSKKNLIADLQKFIDKTSAPQSYKSDAQSMIEYINSSL